MVSSGHSPRPPNEAPLKPLLKNTNKSEVTTWTGQLVRIEQNWFHKQHNSNSEKKTGGSCRLQTKQLLRTVRARAGTRRELQHVLFFFSKLIYKIRQIRYRRSEWLWVVRGSVVPILTTLSFPAYPWFSAKGKNPNCFTLSQQIEVL
jgi:hypothetical protein